MAGILQRILLKLSGEVMAGAAGFGIDAETRVAPSPARSPKWPHRRSDRTGGRRRQLLSRRRRRGPATWTASPPITWACWPR